MSRDSSGESLESILASIRKSLAEQTTSVLEEDAATPAELLPAADMSAADLDAPPVPASLSQRLAVAPDAPQAAVTGLGEEAAAVETTTVMVPPTRSSILALVSPAAPAAPEAPTAPSLVVEPAPAVSTAAAVDNAAAVIPVAVPAEVAPAEAPVAAPAEPTPGPKDPLWFLSQPPASPLLEPKPGRPPEQPKPSRLGAVRGPLPPFFGSSAEEVMKVEMVPDRAVRSRTDAMPPLAAAPPLSAHLDRPPLPASAPDGLHAVNGDGPRVADSAGSARTSAIFDTPAIDSAAGGGGEAQPPQIQALDAMVADLLRPMLRRWLDENMPRLVSAALKAEAELMARRGSGRDPKKP